MKSAAKNFLFALCALPLLAKLPYMVSVWRSSPLESMDWLMWLTIPPVMLASELVRRTAGIEGGRETYKWAVGAALAAAVAVWAALAFRINSAGVLLGVAILALASDLRFGRAVSVSQLPAVFFAVLAAPSVSYWLDYYLHIGLSGTYSYFAFKMAFASVFFAVWCALSIQKRRYPRILSISFCICVCAAALYNRIEANSFPAGDPLFINTDRLSSGEWIARSDPVTAADRKFFKGCDGIARNTYFGPGSRASLLGLRVDDISGVHPVGICLKSSGFQIWDSRQTQIRLDDRTVQVNELLVEKNGQRLAVYSWFSDGEKSTGDFMKFRLRKAHKQKWRHYQLMTPIAEPASDASKTAREFMEAFKE